MIIVGTGECADRDETIAAGTILDHRRLAPAPGQPIREQSRPDIDAAARSERHNEFDRPLRPGLRCRWHRPQDERGEKAESDGK